MSLKQFLKIILNIVIAKLNTFLIVQNDSLLMHVDQQTQTSNIILITKDKLKCFILLKITLDEKLILHNDSLPVEILQDLLRDMDIWYFWKTDCEQIWYLVFFVDLSRVDKDILFFSGGPIASRYGYLVFLEDLLLVDITIWYF